MANEYTQNLEEDKKGDFSSYSGSGGKGKSAKNVILSILDESRDRRDYNRETINRMFKQNQSNDLKNVSEFFYKTNPMYIRFVEYLATMYQNYWTVYPTRPDRMKKSNPDDVTESWFNVLEYIESMNPERLGQTIYREVLVKGEVYIAVKESISNIEGKLPSVGIQFIPEKYCRTTKKYGDRDMVDFNVKFFDEKFRNQDDKIMALQTLPPVLTEAYLAYSNKPNKQAGDEWVTLNPNLAFRFSLRQDGVPYFTSVLLDLMDLSDVKDLTMFKLEQELSKVLVQHFTTDKDGNPIVDVPVMQTFHDNTASMLRNHPGVEVVTTLAEVSVEDLQSSSETASNNPLAKATEAVYNSAGVSSELMNASTSGTLAKSILVDESMLLPLVQQFEQFLNVRIDTNVKKLRSTTLKEDNKFRFRLNILPVTLYNRESMIKWYKDQTTLGYSKFMTPVALGQRQSTVMSYLYFENDILELGFLMQPPMSSNTMSAEALNLNKKGKQADDEDGQGSGRPELADEDRSEKTLANRESL